MTEGRPIVRRFVVRRHPVTGPSGYPWAIRDRTAPHWLGHAATFEAAMRKIDDRVRLEHGMPPRIPVTRAEIQERMKSESPFAEMSPAEERSALRAVNQGARRVYCPRCEVGHDGPCARRRS